MDYLDTLKEIVRILSEETVHNNMPIEWVAIKPKNAQKISIYDGSLHYGRTKYSIPQLISRLNNRITNMGKEAVRAKKRYESGKLLIEFLDKLHATTAATNTYSKIRNLSCESSTSDRRWFLSLGKERNAWGATFMIDPIIIAEQHNKSGKFRLSKIIAHRQKTKRYTSGRIEGLSGWYVAENFLNKAIEKHPELATTLADPQHIH